MYEVVYPLREIYWLPINPNFTYYKPHLLFLLGPTMWSSPPKPQGCLSHPHLCSTHSANWPADWELAASQPQKSLQLQNWQPHRYWWIQRRTRAASLIPALALGLAEEFRRFLYYTSDLHASQPQCQRPASHTWCRYIRHLMHQTNKSERDTENMICLGLDLVRLASAYVWPRSLSLNRISFSRECSAETKRGSFPLPSSLPTYDLLNIYIYMYIYVYICIHLIIYTHVYRYIDSTTYAVGYFADYRIQLTYVCKGRCNVRTKCQKL